MKEPFLKAVFRKGSPYFAVLPYNLNWMLPGRDAMVSRGLASPIVLVDVGCRGGLPDELCPIKRMIQHIGFDADEKECDRLSSEAHELFARSIYPLFVGGRDGESEFHLYQSKGDSSALPPNPRYAELIGGPRFAIEETIPVKTTTLDSFFSANPGLPRPDMIKLDTQGTELDILKGAVKCLETCSLVEAEVEFFPMYKDQPLFHDVMGFMLDQGFELLHLNRVFSQRRGFQGFSKGQITFGDALFVRREDRLDRFDEQMLMRLAILLVNYGYLDLAYNLLAIKKFHAGDRAFLESYLKQRIDRWSVRRMKRAIIPFIDKLVLALLHFRKHNSLTFDSDRSWPSR